MSLEWERDLGTSYLGNGRCRFCIWAPLADKVELHIMAPQDRVVAMERAERGYYQAVVEGVEPGGLYRYRLDGSKEWPDPASRFQPQGVHGPSQVIDPHFNWGDDRWFGLALQDYIIYELHVGAFTTEGTFDAIIPYLDELKDLGITAVQLMPVAQFPGGRNWGYDGVYPFAVQDSYGGPDGLRRLVNACHQRGLAVILDVVYNHLGPEGNYLGEFGPYFTGRYQTPWGSALNFDGAYSDEVRRLFIENALYWITEFHIDALRLDALHAILDLSAYPFLQELATSVHEQGERLGRTIYLFAESDRNDARLIRPQELGGYGLDAHWNDDFHHALHALLTGEQFGYYQDFGELWHLAKALTEGFVYSGQYSVYRRRRHGSSSRDLPASRFVVFAQNHDQVGNRMLGERLSQTLCFDRLKLAAGAVLLAPFIPLLFMGEEYGETAPFLYFISHADPELVAAVRRGRREEFSAFAWPGEPPDPQNQTTFLRSKLDHGLRHQGHHHVLLQFYRELVQLRKTHPALANLSKEHLEVASYEGERVLFLRRWNEGEEAVIAFNFSEARASVTLPVPPGHWRKGLDSAEERWQGCGSSLPVEFDSYGEVELSVNPWAFVLYIKET